MRNWVQRLAFVVVGGLLPLAVSGCGADDGIGRRYPISGTVTYNGQPVEQGTIGFYPKDPEGRGASGSIRDGRYANVSTLQPGDGILPGTYIVTVSATEDVDFSAIEAEAAGGVFDQLSVGTAVEQANSLIPRKYASLLTSGLEVEVKPERNTFNIELHDD